MRSREERFRDTRRKTGATRSVWILTAETRDSLDFRALTKRFLNQSGRGSTRAQGYLSFFAPAENAAHPLHVQETLRVVYRGARGAGAA
jgi:hypothetical protein